MCRYSGPPDGPVCGLHQRNENPTLNVPVHYIVQLLSFFTRRLAILFRVAVTYTPSSPSTEAKKRRKISTLLEACLQVHLIIFPLCLLKALLWCISRIRLSVSVNDSDIVNTVCPILPEVTDQKIALLFCGL